VAANEGHGHAVTLAPPHRTSGRRSSVGEIIQLGSAIRETVAPRALVTAVWLVAAEAAAAAGPRVREPLLQHLDELGVGGAGNA